ncbi:lasso peptide biosynthesis B2 protein [Sandaracinus amylolyticus]|uniref:lasso peptide biosynthesis B2 protein n=1 Tax=Sandaracinus amylolyticus TaxID=927083 RepID=UPI001F1DFD2F|nr:lasso peptide biosynthesis B2 protein [Sandaracinus amylolyticus]UJR80436.1 Hypothetical protein I5071_24830 [Sandaracinus amylolyticus]
MPLIRTAVRRARCAARYVALRIDVVRRFRSDPLDALLASLDRPTARATLTREDVTAGIAFGEGVSRRCAIGPDTCLYRALARYALLRESGYAPRFVMGVDEDDVASGHAWLELDGAPFLEPGSPRFCRTFEHPPRT